MEGRTCKANKMTMTDKNTELDVSPWPSDMRTWLMFLAGFAPVFALFQFLGNELESGRGEAGLLIGAIITLATLLTDKWLTGEPFKKVFFSLGLGMPAMKGILLALAASLLMLLIIPAVIIYTKASWSMYPGWLGLLPGLFAQSGIAEETLFRGYLFRHLRKGRTFMRAAVMASIPFIAAHSILFFTMPWVIALASLLLSAIISFPLARLFEASGNTIWAPAILHFVVQSAVKVIVIEGQGLNFPVVWMLAAAVIPFVVFLYRPSVKGKNDNNSAIK